MRRKRESMTEVVRRLKTNGRRRDAEMLAAAQLIGGPVSRVPPEDFLFLERMVRRHGLPVLRDESLLTPADLRRWKRIMRESVIREVQRDILEGARKEGCSN